jgi:hypothetical protein
MRWEWPSPADNRPEKRELSRRTTRRQARPSNDGHPISIADNKATPVTQPQEFIPGFVSLH